MRDAVLALPMRWLVLIIAVGCASSSTPSTEPNVERGPTRADIDPAVHVAPRAPSYGVSVHPGYVDVHSAEGFPGRALDPVLHAGELELREYEHVGVEVLRFATEVEVRGPFELHWGSDVYELSR